MNYEFNEHGFVKIDSPKWGEVYVCNEDWIRDQAIRKGKFAFTPDEVEKFKSIKDKHGMEMVGIAKQIFKGVILE